MTKLSINIDMGAKNNGVFVAKIENDKIVAKNAFNVEFSSDINFSKIDRTAKRHQRRGNSRKTMLNRLLDEIFADIKFNQNDKELIYGLTKNRGFTFQNIKFEDEISQNSVIEFKNIKDYDFSSCINLDDFEDKINDKLDEFNSDEAIKYFERQIRIISDLKPKKGDKNKISNEFKSDINKAIEVLQSIKNELERNAKHRKQYILDILNLCKNDDKIKKIIAKTKFSNLELANLICNLSNLQTRTLRKYFNDKSDTKFDGKKLLEKIEKNINFMHFKSDEEKANLKIIRSNLNKSAIEFLTQTDPNITIPPYEDLNNKNPLKCNALVLKNPLDNILENILEKILKNENFKNLTIDKNGEIKENFADFSVEQKQIYMQRFLDISKDFLDDEALYPRNLDKDYEIFKREIGLNDMQIKCLKNFCKDYYDEISLAKKGFLSQNLLRSCDLHTPYKNNIKHEHISAVFNKEISKDISDKLNTLITQQNPKISGNLTLSGFLKNLSELRKDESVRNKFFIFLCDIYEQISINTQIQANLNNDLIKEFEKILKNYKFAADEINKCGKIFEFSEFNQKNLKHNFNILLQIADIYLDDSKGFNKTCTKHTIENRLRMSAFGSAFCSRLSAKSARLINGKIEMFLDRLAFEIKNQISSNFKFDDFDEIQINIESNKFSFEEGLKQIELKKDKKQIKEKELICPYNGTLITLNSCEFDHIIPRSKEFLNSSANLIPVSMDGNQTKLNKKYSLDNLHENYLKNIAKQINIDFNAKFIGEFEKFINENISNIDEKNYSNFDNLSLKQQIAFRHALFLDENQIAYKAALKLLRSDKIKTPSNGTQKRLITLLIDKLKKEFKNAKFSINLIDAKLISANRANLARQYKNIQDIQKQKFQNSHSHCIDAMSVFDLCNKKEFEFKEIYLDDSDIISPKAKTYLELVQKNKNISSKPLFKDSIYALEFDSLNLKDKEKEILFNLGILFIKKDGKKQICDQIPQDKFFIDTHKIFEKIFEAFENRDIKFLEKIKFIDKHLKKYIKKDIFGIFFDKDDLKPIESNNKDIKKRNEENEKNKEKWKKFLEEQPNNITKFYNILLKNENKIYDKKTDEEKKILKKDEVKRLFKDKFYTQKQKSQKRARNKNRVIYSLKTLTNDGKFVVRRNGGFEGLANEDIATKNYFDKGQIVQTSFFSKNILPLKISEILDILNLSQNAKQIYEVKITKNLPPEILSLDFIVKEKGRHEVFVNFDKSKMDCDFVEISKELNPKNENFKAFCDEILNGKFKEFLGKPRDLKADLIKNDNKVLSLSYKVETTSKANKDLIIQELL